METKNDVVREICDSLGIKQIATTVGSSIPRSLFTEISNYFNISNNGTAISVAKRVIGLAGNKWESHFDSSSTPSGGGGTITFEGLLAIRDSVNMLLDIEDGIIQKINKVQPVLSESEWTIFEGQKILRSTLHERYGGNLNSTISKSSTSNNIFLFTDSNAISDSSIMFNNWINANTFQFFGEKFSDFEDLTDNNASVLEHENKGRKLRLFKGIYGTVVYIGEFEIAKENNYFEVAIPNENSGYDKYLVFNLLKINSSPGAKLVSEVDIGRVYEFENEELRGLAEVQPFTIDQDLLDRGTTKHAITQNNVARWLLSHGIEPLSPKSSEAPFDIAWVCRGRLFVGEIKSITDENEIHQFRLGLGQVLDYSASLNAVPVLILSDQPKVERLEIVASKSRTTLLWPSKLPEIDPFNLR